MDAAISDSDGNLARRLVSETNTEHYQALDELYVYQLLQKLHSDVRYEEGGKGPDFRLYEGPACIAAIEVLSLFQREDWILEQMRHARLADAVDAKLRPTAGYFVEFHIEHATHDPSPTQFIRCNYSATHSNSRAESANCHHFPRAGW